MRDGIIDNKIFRTAEVAHDRNIGGVTADKDQRGFRVFPLCDRRFEFTVDLLFTCQEAASAGRRSVFANRGNCSLFRLRPSGHTGVVI